jgi:hypothetical protein
MALQISGVISDRLIDGEARILTMPAAGRQKRVMRASIIR